MSKTGLPKRCYEKHGAFYFVDRSNKWHRLCSVADGLPEAYRALARLIDRIDSPGQMPHAVQTWIDKQRHKWAPSTRKDREAIGLLISKGFAQFHASDVTTPDVDKFLSKWASKPRYYNVIKGVLSQVLRHAAVQGWREGHNPCDNISGQATPGRKRVVSDAEIVAMRAALSAATYSTGMLAVLDLALLTGQRIGDIIALRWQDVRDDGLHITQAKTGARLVVGWSADLRRAIERCAPKDARIGHVIKTRTGSAYTYWGVKSAWERALIRASIEDLHIHDLRGRAGVDKRDAEGIEAAQAMLGHGSVRMTEHYTEGKTIKRTRANKLPKAPK